MLKSDRPSCRAGRGILAALAILAVCATDHVRAALIWERAGPFQACLEGRFEKWVQSWAELAANEDPRVGNIDDAAVAQWTTHAIDACRAQAGGGDAESEARFGKHMARWRSHIYDLAQSIKQRAGPD
jgi:hypothetical protein